MGALAPGSAHARHSPEFVFTPNLIFFCELKPHAKFRNPTITPSGRKVTSGERREREKKQTINR
jgi:hypothetical protein